MISNFKNKEDEDISFKKNKTITKIAVREKTGIVVRISVFLAAIFLLSFAILGYSFSKSIKQNKIIDNLATSDTTKSTTICGDVNGDGTINVADLTYLTAYLFNSGPAPVSLSNADVNGDGDVNVADINYLTSYLWKNGPEPVCNVTSSQTYASCDDVPASVLGGRTCRLTDCSQYLTQDNSYYLLTKNVTAAKTGCVVKATNTIFNLNENSITYGMLTGSTLSNGNFENGNTGWDLSTAAKAQIIDGTLVRPVSVFSGSKSLQFTLPANAQSVSSTQNVTVSANTTYALTAMVYNYVDEAITVTVNIDGTIYSASKTGITWRGFQLVEVIFRPTTDVTAPITISISGTGLSSSGKLYVDDVRIQPAQYYGIVFPTYDNGRYPDIDVESLPSGNPNNITITNGTIIQGAGSPFAGHNFYFGEGVHDIIIDHVNATVQGPESSNIFAEWSYNNSFHDNTLTSNVLSIMSRDNFSGVQINLGRTRGGNTIYNNTIQNGPHTGLMMGDFDNTSQGGSQIYNNLFRMKSRYTNGFAIAGGDRNAQVHNNTVMNVDGYYGRGIHGGNGAHFYSNHIEVSDMPYNQEYDGCSPPGVYGFQVEEGEGTEVTNNTIIARTGTGLCDAMGLRFTSPFSGITIDKNTVTAINVDGSDNRRAYVASFARGDYDSGDMSGAPLTHNLFTSNSSWFHYGYWAPSSPNNIYFEGNTFLFGGTLYNFIAQHGVSATSIEYVDNIYGNAAAKFALENSNIYWNTDPDPASDFAVKWHYNPTIIDANGNPASLATIVIKDKNGTIVYEGSTNISGQLDSPVLLVKFINDDGAITSFEPYTATITLFGSSVPIVEEITYNDLIE